MTPGTEALDRNVDFHNQLVEDESSHYAMQWEKIARIARLLATFAPKQGDLADIGSFTGLATTRYVEACAARSACCFDISAVALDKCRKRGFQAVEWNCEQRCPAPDAAFSTIVAADVIEHLVNTDGFVNELRRILRPGGIVVISTPNLAYWLNRLRLARGWAPWSYPGVSSTFRRSESVDLNHIRINVPQEWIGLFEARGFTCVHRTGYSIFRVWSSSRWGAIRTRVDEFADDRVPNLAFGNLFCFTLAD